MFFQLITSTKYSVIQNALMLLYRLTTDRPHPLLASTGKSDFNLKHIPITIIFLPLFYMQYSSFTAA